MRAAHSAAGAAASAAPAARPLAVPKTKPPVTPAARLATAVACLACALAACAPSDEGKDEMTNDDAATLKIETLKEGVGETVESGMTAVVHYTGWLHDPDAADGRGKKFDSSRDRGDPFRFPVGAGRVIRGWDEGVAGMRVGEVRELSIPPRLGYGSAGAGGGLIPPDSTLIFEVELVGIEQ